MLLVVDARSPLAVKGNQIAGGKGTETLEHYEGVRMRLEFMGIANIHAVRAAHDGLVDAVCGRGDFAAACARTCCCRRSRTRCSRRCSSTGCSHR